MNGTNSKINNPTKDTISDNAMITIIVIAFIVGIVIANLTTDKWDNDVRQEAMKQGCSVTEDMIITCPVKRIQP